MLESNYRQRQHRGSPQFASNFLTSTMSDGEESSRFGDERIAILGGAMNASTDSRNDGDSEENAPALDLGRSVAGIEDPNDRSVARKFVEEFAHGRKEKFKSYVHLAEEVSKANMNTPFCCNLPTNKGSLETISATVNCERMRVLLGKEDGASFQYQPFYVDDDLRKPNLRERGNMTKVFIPYTRFQFVPVCGLEGLHFMAVLFLRNGMVTHQGRFIPFWFIRKHYGHEFFYYRPVQTKDGLKHSEKRFGSTFVFCEDNSRESHTWYMNTREAFDDLKTVTCENKGDEVRFLGDTGSKMNKKDLIKTLGKDAHKITRKIISKKFWKDLFGAKYWEGDDCFDILRTMKYLPFLPWDSSSLEPKAPVLSFNDPRKKETKLYRNPFCQHMFSFLNDPLTIEGKTYDAKYVGVTVHWNKLQNSRDFDDLSPFERKAMKRFTEKLQGCTSCCVAETSIPDEKPILWWTIKEPRFKGNKVTFEQFAQEELRLAEESNPIALDGSTIPGDGLENKGLFQETLGSTLRAFQQRMLDHQPRYLKISNKQFKDSFQNEQTKIWLRFAVGLLENYDYSDVVDKTKALCKCNHSDARFQVWNALKVQCRVGFLSDSSWGPWSSVLATMPRIELEVKCAQKGTPGTGNPAESLPHDDDKRIEMEHEKGMRKRKARREVSLLPIEDCLPRRLRVKTGGKEPKEKNAKRGENTAKGDEEKDEDEEPLFY